MAAGLRGTADTFFYLYRYYGFRASPGICVASALGPAVRRTSFCSVGRQAGSPARGDNPLIDLDFFAYFEVSCIDRLSVGQEIRGD